MKIRVYWDYPDFYTNSEDTYEDVEVDNNATDDEIEQVAKETALEHFEWSWDKLK